MPEALSVRGRCTGRAHAVPCRRRPETIFAGLMAAALLSACGGGDSQTKVQPRPVTVSTVRVTPSTGTVDVGSTLQLAASALDAAGAALAGRTFTWTSLTPAVATVSAAGLLTGVTTGSVTVSAAADGVSGSATVAVTVPVSARCDATQIIDLGQVVTGAIASTDCRLSDGSYADKFVLTLAESTPVRISMTGTVDAFLILQDAATGTIIAQNDDGNGDTGARIEQVVPAGRYIVVASTFDPGDFGDYQLTLSRASPACLNATPIGANATVTGTLTSTACMLPDSSFVDRYTLTVVNSTILDVTMRSTTFDAVLFVEKTTGESIQRNDNGGGGRDARILATVTAGTYIIYANSSNARETGAYTLALSSQLDPCGANRAVTVGATITDTLTSSACRLADGSFVKRFTFAVTATTPVRLDLTSTQFDPYIFLQLAGSATKIAEDDDSGPGLNAEVLQVLAPGDYVITVTSATAGETGIFDLAVAGAVQGTVAVAVTPATATLLPGETQQLTATVTGTTNSNVLWKSGTPTIASVSATGVVRAITAGSANVVVTSAADPSRTASALVTVNAGTGTNLDVPLVYLTQSVQTADGRLPLVADRPTIARVFVRGSRSGLGTAPVRVRFFNGATVLGTITGTATVATVTDESCCSADIAVPAAFVRDGVTLIADVDPNNTIAETNEDDNAWPLTGASKPIRVVTVPNINVQLVPIRHRTTNQVSTPTATLASLMQRMYPVSQVSVTVHADYTTDSPPLTDGASWISMLNQIDALRTLEASTAYYYGVLNQQSAPGIVGIAGVFGFSGVVVGGPEAKASETFAHEVGHSFGRQHSPTPVRCGVPSGVDANYPRSDGTIGFFGYDLQLSLLYLPDKFDIMGYCDGTWASEYTYAGILRYLKSGAIPISRGTITEVPILLITGSSSNGTVSVDPVFSATAAPTAQRTSGAFMAEGRASDGRVLFRHRFDGVAITDLDPSTHTFVAAVPYDAAVSGAVASISVTNTNGGGRPALLTRSGVYTSAPGGVSLRVDADPQLVVRATGGNRYDVAWNISRYPSLVIRNATTRRVLGIGRRGVLSIDATSLAELEVLLSDGVSSSARKLAVTSAP